MTAAVASSSLGRAYDEFLSVFPPRTFTIPTPEATPFIGTLASPGPQSVSFAASEDLSDNIASLSRAWSTATRFLTLLPALDSKAQAVPGAVVEACALILQHASSRKELIAWYFNEVQSHFRAFVRPSLRVWDSPISPSHAGTVVQSTLRLLQKAQEYYFAQVDSLKVRLVENDLAIAFNQFHSRLRWKLHALVLHSLPRQRLQKTLASVMYRQLESTLQTGSDTETCIKDSQCHCRLDTDSLPLKELHDVGLGGALGEQAFAHAMHKFLRGPGIERRCFQVDWSGQASVMPKLRGWVEQHLSSVIVQPLLAFNEDTALPRVKDDIQNFRSMAVSNLGRARTQALFDYIQRWPASTGAILDIREYLNVGGPAEKAHVCQSFSEQVQRRLLHAGASTSEVLSIYVHVIQAFKTLDSRGVLFEKVATSIRKYLRSREDTVSIIAASFLAEIEQDGALLAADSDKVCPDITIEVARSSLAENKEGKPSDWDDMEWVPDPIDAGPNYKSSKSEDAIAHILGLFEQEEFIKEVTAVLAQHLLHGTDPEFVKETRLVELFKSRLDASRLQAAEVMLKDVRDSVSLGKRINPFAHYETTTVRPPPTPREIQAAIPEGGITLAALYKVFEGRIRSAQFVAALKLVANRRDDLFYAKRTRIPHDPSERTMAGKERGKMDFKTQVLSSFFWPQLRSNNFRMPSKLTQFSDAFERRFNALGGQRRLHFRPALARVSIRLEMEDRVVEESDVPGWRAAVIDMFTEESEQQLAGDKNVTVPEIVSTLDMEEELVRDALNFWVNKKVLHERSPGVFNILERMDMDVAVAASPLAASQQQAESLSAVVSQDAMLKESAPMYETFIANMLRNQGPKQIGGMMGITNLLKMVLPGFTHGDDEVAWLLGDMQARGEVMSNGHVWSVAQ